MNYKISLMTENPHSSNEMDYERGRCKATAGGLLTVRVCVSVCAVALYVE